MKYETKARYNIDDLREIMKILREPDGCPWDREQNHESICKNMIEEAYEAVEAIRNGDLDGMCEELGDVLMQVVFHARIEEEKGGFNLDDIADVVCKKLIYRHPHVFGDITVENSAEVLKNWDMLKRVEKSQRTQTDVLKAVPGNLPALMRNEKIQQKAERAGCAVPNEEACRTELARLASEPIGDAKAYIGSLLKTVVALARVYQVDPEEALTSETERFIAEFADGEAQKNKISQ